MNKKNQTKKKIRVEGIPMGRSIVTFGKNIEAKMNSMLKDGYRVNLFEREEGMLVLGDAVPEPEYEPAHSLMRLVQLQVPGQQPMPKNSVSERTDQLIGRFMGSARSRDPKVLIEAARRQATHITRGFSVEELQHAIAEVLKEAEEHENDPNHEEKNCGYSACLRALAELLKESAAANLQ